MRLREALLKAWGKGYTHVVRNGGVFEERISRWIDSNYVKKDDSVWDFRKCYPSQEMAIVERQTNNWIGVYRDMRSGR